MWEKEPSSTVGMQIRVATMGNSMEVPQKIKNRTVLWPTNSTSRYVSEGIWNTNLKGYIHLYVHCSITYNSQDMESTQVPISRQLNKEEVAHIYNGILLSHKKNEILPFATVWIHLEHRWQTQGPRAESSPAPCFYPTAVPSSLPLVKE